MRRPGARGWVSIAGTLAVLGTLTLVVAADPPAGGKSPAVERVGIPWTGNPGILETVAEIMAREARTPRPAKPVIRPRKPEWEFVYPKRDNPDAPALSRWPPRDASSTESGPLTPQPIGPVNFKAISLLSPNESLYLPPDSMGDVGPTQILAVANGRIKVFDKTGVVGGLNADLDGFFITVTGGVGVSDPQVRYDRLSGRWFVAGITINTPNKIVIAVSSGSTITGSSSFTFYFFQHDLVGTTPNSDTGGFADYDSLGVDRFALYIGTNTFNAAGTAFLGTTGFVVNKADLLNNLLTVTAFRQLAGSATSAPGPYCPRGVDNDDPAATEGYFIGTDTVNFSKLDIRRVSNPGGNPSISPNLVLTVPTTNFPILVPHLGMATSRRRLDPLDDRLFAARLHKDKISGVASLWTAHNIQVNSSGVANNNGGRDGARWYEIRNLTATPTLNQSGTLFDSAATNPRFFWIPSVAMSGQGHMALGSSTAGTNFRADVAVAGRYSGDPLGTIQSYTPATASSTAYNQQAVDGQRWGDYSATIVDPADDMTFWTFQEYCDATDSWAVRAVQLLAPPPATPSAAAPATVCQGNPSASVIITGTSSSSSGFFDPGPDTGGPGYARIAGTVTGGVTVSSVTFNTPTQVTLGLSASAATAGAKDVTITNPDGQSRTGTGILTVAPQPASPSASNNGPVCAGSTLQLFASTVTGASYSWTGPNGFTSSQQNPSIPAATAAAAGSYSVTVTVSGCTSAPATTTASVATEGGACNDGNSCTRNDTCQAGTCTGSFVVCTTIESCHLDGACDPGTGLCINPAAPDGTPCNDGNACTLPDTCQTGTCTGGAPRDADLDSHVDALCGGNDCNDTNPLVWFTPAEVTNLLLTTASPADPSWGSQGALVGPGTLYDLVSGGLTSAPGISFAAASCLQPGGGNSFSDTRPDPTVGQGFWYLARGRNSCGSGTYGTPLRDGAIPACP